MTYTFVLIIIPHNNNNNILLSLCYNLRFTYLVALHEHSTEIFGVFLLCDLIY